MTLTPRKPLLRTLAFVAALGAAVSLAGCSAGAEPGDSGAASQSSEDSKISIASVIENDWDPLGDIGGGGIVPIASLVYDALIYNDGNDRLSPGAAENWEFSDDGLQLTFELRDGLEFSDGAPLDAAAAKVHFDRAIEKSPVNLPNVVSVEAPDEKTLRFNLSSPNSELPLQLTQVSKPGLIPSPNATPESLVTTPIGSGPYLLESQTVNDHAVLVKNPDYWDAESIHIEEVAFYPSADPAAAVKDVQTGVYDVAWVDPSSLAEAEAVGLTVTESERKTTYTFDFNINREPFDDPKVVEALKYAFDRDDIVDTLTFGYGVATNQPAVEGQIGYVAENKDLWKYDPEKAKDLLAEAGYDESNPLSFEFKSGNSQEYTAFAEYVAQSLQQIGVEVSIATIPAAQVYPVVYQQKDALVKRGFSPASNTRTGINTTWGESGVVNLSAPYTDPTIDSLTAQLGSVPFESEEHDALIAEINDQATKEWPSVTLYQLGGFAISNGRLSEVKINLAASYGLGLSLHDVTLKD